MEHIRQILENLELHAGKLIKEENLNLKCECRFLHIFTITSLDDWCNVCNDTDFINKKKIDINDNLYNLDFNFRLFDMDMYGICTFICRRGHVFTSDIEAIPDECEKCKQLLQDSDRYKIAENISVFSVINSSDNNHSDSTVNFQHLTDKDNSDNEEYYDSYYNINGSLDEVSHNSEDSYYRLYESDSDSKSNNFNDDESSEKNDDESSEKNDDESSEKNDDESSEKNDDFIDITENFLNDCDDYTLSDINLEHKDLIEQQEEKDPDEVPEFQPIEVISHTNNIYVNLDSIKKILLNKPICA